MYLEFIGPNKILPYFSVYIYFNGQILLHFHIYELFPFDEPDTRWFSSVLCTRNVSAFI